MCNPGSVHTNPFMNTTISRNLSSGEYTNVPVLISIYRLDAYDLKKGNAHATK